MNKGKIIFLNGVTSAGKTSVGIELRDVTYEQMGEVYYHLSNDTFHNAIGAKFWFEDMWKAVAHNITTLYYAVKGISDNGVNVIIDGMLLEAPEFVQLNGDLHYKTMKSILSDIEIFMVELYCPLEECRRRNIARGDRHETQSDEQNEMMSKEVEYDFTIDTSKFTPKECAEQIVAAFIEHNQTKGNPTQ